MERAHRMIRATGAATLAAGLLLSGCASSPGTANTGRRAGDAAAARAAGTARLIAFPSCARLLAELRAATERHVGPYGLPGGGYGGDVAAPPGRRAAGDAGGPVPGTDARPEAGAAGPGATAAQPPGPAQAKGHSGTNVHESGVDEPDLVKTDGRRIVTVTGGRLRVVDAATHRETGTLELPRDAVPGSAPGGQANLLLHGNRALLLHQYSPPIYGGPVRPDAGVDGGAAPKVTPVPPHYGAQMTLVDLSSAPRIVGRLNVDGLHVDARQVGGVARVVVRSTPRFTFPPPISGQAPEAATGQMRRSVRQAPAQAWLPRFEVERDGRRESRSVPCERISHPPVFSGMSTVSIFTVDLAGTLDDGDPVSVVADGDTVYGTATSLYVTSHPQPWITWPPVRPDRPGWPDRPGRPRSTTPIPPRPPSPATEIHRFDIGRPGPPRYAASGRVAGRLLNQYALSEHQGRLRVATTLDPIGPASSGEGASASQSAVHVLVQRGDRFVTEGKVDGLGKGERIYAVRFLGSLGYVVTFRETDPLYVVDLRTPAKPRVAGELKITGYSAYLHPAGDGRLIGVGQEATEEGGRLGTQVSLFDVSDPARPRRLDSHHVTGGTSEVEFDPHAFLYWPQTGLTVVPVRRPAQADRAPGNEALVLAVAGGSVERRGSVRHPRPDGAEALPGGTDIRRSMVLGDTLWTMSGAGLRATRADGLDEVAWVPFG